MCQFLPYEKPRPQLIYQHHILLIIRGCQLLINLKTYLAICLVFFEWQTILLGRFERSNGEFLPTKINGDGSGDSTLTQATSVTGSPSPSGDGLPSLSVSPEASTTWTRTSALRTSSKNLFPEQNMINSMWYFYLFLFLCKLQELDLPHLLMLRVFFFCHLMSCHAQRGTRHFPESGKCKVC